MDKKDKAEVVARLSELFTGSTLTLATDFRGLTAQEMTRLRRRLEEAGVAYRVAKNTLARLAARKAGKAAIEPLLEGPTALAFGSRDEVATGRAVTEYIRTSKTALRLKGGLLRERALTPAEVQLLSSLPPREVLIAQVIGKMKAPMAAIPYILSTPLNKLALVLQARVRQMEGG